MNISHLQHIQPLFDEAVKQNKIAGLNCLIYKDGKEIGYWQSGFRDRDNKIPYSRDTILRMYSMTKPVTSIAAMILVEQGKLDLGEELGVYLPSFNNLQVCTDKGRNGTPHKAWNKILIQDLLNMTSGYTYGAWSEDSPLGEHLTSQLINDLNKDAEQENKITTQDVAERLSKIPVSFEPGTAYNYGLSADILGAIIEKVSGMKFSLFLKKNIFEPLGMNDTAFFVPSEKQNRLSKVYKTILNDDGTRFMEEFRNCNLGIQADMKNEPAFESGGAGLCSTVDDYMKFALMLTQGGEFNGKRVLQKRTVEYLSQARLRDNLQQSFNNMMPHLSGYTYCNLMRVAFEPGKCKAVTQQGEFGWDGWLGPYVSVDLNNKLTIVMTMQRTDAGTTDVTRRMKNIVYTGIN